MSAPRAHPLCRGPEGHVCQEPSGRSCVERGCDEPAGTWWGPFWCPRHDLERLERVDGQLNDLLSSFAERPPRADGAPEAPAVDDGN